jgi:hypothetical protein
LTRYVIAFAVAAVLGTAVYGATASLGEIGNADLGAADAAVPACDDNGVTTTYTVLYDAGIKVDKVKVSGIANACLGNIVNLYLTKAGTLIASGELPVAAGPPDDNFAEFTFGTSGPLAADVDDIHVSIR